MNSDPEGNQDQEQGCCHTRDLHKNGPENQDGETQDRDDPVGETQDRDDPDRDTQKRDDPDRETQNRDDSDWDASDEYSDGDTQKEDSDWGSKEMEDIKERKTEIAKVTRKYKSVYWNGLLIVEGLEWEGPEPGWAEDKDAMDKDSGWDASDEHSYWGSSKEDHEWVNMDMEMDQTSGKVDLHRNTMNRDTKYE